MSAIAKMYGEGPLSADWVNDSIYIALLDSTFTPDQDAQVFWSDVNAHEISGTGYSAGGILLTGNTVSYNTSTNTSTYFSASVAWANATFTCRYAVIYRSTGNAATSRLLGYVDMGGTQAVSGSSFTLGLSSGVFTSTVS